MMTGARVAMRNVLQIQPLRVARKNQAELYRSLLFKWKFCEIDFPVLQDARDQRCGSGHNMNGSL